MSLLLPILINIFLNGPLPASFSFIFGLLKQTTIFTSQCEKYPSSIRRRDSNPPPLEHDSSPIITRPEAGFLNNFFHESCNFQIKVATLKFLGFLNKAISSEGFNFVAACLNGFFKHFFTP